MGENPSGQHIRGDVEVGVRVGKRWILLCPISMHLLVLQVSGLQRSLARSGVEQYSAPGLVVRVGDGLFRRRRVTTGSRQLQARFVNLGILVLQPQIRPVHEGTRSCIACVCVVAVRQRREVLGSILLGLGLQMS